MSLLPALSLIASSFLLGAMLFFASVAAPAIFKFLPEDARPPMLRGIFPRYYAWCAVVALIASGLAAPVHTTPAAIMGAVTLGFLFLRYGLIPKIEIAREGRSQGDEAARAQFATLHRLSVFINLAQMVATIAAVGLMVQAGV
ncbi:MAG: DUF4149 domain-containing protein [Rhodospirillaceae bacterium]|jgi:hypothetical protein|nr:DUF4149 domain-containing protein [Rhodospirillales bacterium]MBT3904492.1 DUF4149 domain-containing protein [Rhodospirillaceae bacterium]MBT4702760.1 DUF4149 domain-containing protein [Rhodospirillaceae bacterium]MBT5036687.1 DUF4149 domain-containing protein [Rhodospirillaceae bacterium]MBT6220887.1 DUF4149 domain-containing protein [Rhodospirillaceae bacterium]